MSLIAAASRRLILSELPDSPAGWYYDHSLIMEVEGGLLS